MKALAGLCGITALLLLRAQTLPPAGSPAGKRVLAVIGVGSYSNPLLWHPIEASERSARAFLRMIPDAFGYVAADSPPLGSSATATSVQAFLERVVSGLSAEDDLIVYFAGHGVSRPEETGGRLRLVGYLALSDAGEPQGRVGLLKVESMLDLLDRAPARIVLVILDACESGIAIPRLAFGGRLGDGRLGTSRVLITSAQARQSAVADGGLYGATLFSGILLDLLESGRCDVSGDGYCTATELVLLARRRLAAQSAKQTPTVEVFGGDEAADFRLYRFGPEARDWVEAKSESADPDQLERFLKSYPAGVYAGAARQLQRERVEKAIRSFGHATTGDLKLVSGQNARQSVSWSENGAVFMWIPEEKSGYWMSKLEVSVEDYRKFSRNVMPRAPSFNGRWADPGQPMVNVSWPQAQAYCASLGGSLPSVEQWQRAARARKAWRFPWGDEVRPDLANLAGTRYDRHLFAAPADGYAGGENEWQLRNLIGNVSEWTATLIDTDVGPKAVVVGGSFADRWETAGLNWHKDVELGGSNTVGFRCIVVPGVPQ